jgi:hypothetical protein
MIISGAFFDTTAAYVFSALTYVCSYIHTLMHAGWNYLTNNWTIVVSYSVRINNSELCYVLLV